MRLPWQDCSNTFIKTSCPTIQYSNVCFSQLIWNLISVTIKIMQNLLPGRFQLKSRFVPISVELQTISVDRLSVKELILSKFTCLQPLTLLKNELVDIYFNRILQNTFSEFLPQKVCMKPKLPFVKPRIL